MKKGRKRDKSELQSLQSGIAGVLGAKHLKRLADIARVRRMWVDMVGSMLAQHSEPMMIESSCLWVAVNHSVMAQHIRFLQKEIAEACIKKCHVHGISRVRTRVRPEAGVQMNRKLIAHQAQAVPWAEKKTIVRVLSCVQDPSLKRAIFKARIAQLSFQEK